jgi:hypothetical protein
MSQHEQSIEDVLRAYARPFAGLYADQAALDTAAAIWDLVIDGLSTDEIVRRLDEDADAHVAKVVAAFVERKRVHFGADRRYVVGSRV